MYDFTKDDETFEAFYAEKLAPGYVKLPEVLQRLLKINAHTLWMHKTILHIQDVQELSVLVKEIFNAAHEAVL